MEENYAKTSFSTPHGKIDPVNFTVSTKRLFIRPITLEDVPDFFEFRRRDEVVKWTSSSVTNTHVSQTTAWLVDRIAAAVHLDIPQCSIELLDPSAPNSGSYEYEFTPDEPGAISQKRTLKIIGGIAAHAPPEIGYVLNPTAWGKGYATEALKGFLELYWACTPRPGEGKNGRGFDRAEGLINPINVSSQKVLEKCGFKMVELRKRDIETPMMGWIDGAVYRIERPQINHS